MSANIIAYRNIFNDGTLSATTSATDFDITNLATWSESDQWKPTAAGTNNVVVQQTANLNVNYFYIIGHNLADEAGVKIVVQYSSDNFSSDINTIETIDVFSSDAIFREFTQVGAYEYWRLQIVTSALIPALAVVALGEYDDFAHGHPFPFVAPWQEGFKIENQVSEQNSFIGRINKAIPKRLQITQSNASDSWFRSTWLPFLEHAKNFPFIWSWDKDRFTKETAFCWSMGPSSPRYTSQKHATDTLNVNAKGFIGQVKPIFDAPLASSLDLRSGSGSMTFTRAGSATYVDLSGVVQTATTDVARFEADGLLMEPAATNTILWSEQMDNAGWNKSQSTVTTNAATAPDGLLNAEKIVEDTATSGHWISQPVSVISGDIYSFSFFAKQAGRTEVQVRMNDSSTDIIDSIIDLTDGSVVSTTVGSVRVTLISNGWYRIDGGGTSTATSGAATAFIAISNGGSTSYTGDGASGVFAWGAQLEDPGATTSNVAASSYIKTTTISVTRPTDNCVIDYASNMPELNSKYTVVADFKLNIIVDDQALIFASGLSFQAMYAAAIGQAQVKFGNATLNADQSISRLTTYRIAAIRDGDSVSVYFDGTLDKTTSGITDGTGTAPASLNIGSEGTGTDVINGHVSKLRVFDRALTADEVARL